MLIAKFYVIDQMFLLGISQIEYHIKFNSLMPRLRALEFLCKSKTKIKLGNFYVLGFGCLYDSLILNVYTIA